MSNIADDFTCEWFIDTAASEVDRHDSTIKAVGIWMGYPLLAETIECRPGTTDDEKCAMRNALDGAHYRATHILMFEAEREGLNPAALIESHRVCLLLFNRIRGQSPASATCGVNWFHHPNSAFSTWPDGLGDWRYDLPSAVQETIRQGEEVFARLMIRLSITPADARNAGEALGQDGQAKLPAGTTKSEHEGEDRIRKPKLARPASLKELADAIRKKHPRQRNVPKFLDLIADRDAVDFDEIAMSVHGAMVEDNAVQKTVIKAKKAIAEARLPVNLVTSERRVLKTQAPG
jgi:hypothetical protein